MRTQINKYKKIKETIERGIENKTISKNQANKQIKYTLFSLVYGEYPSVVLIVDLTLLILSTIFGIVSVVLYYYNINIVNYTIMFYITSIIIIFICHKFSDKYFNLYEIQREIIEDLLDYINDEKD